MKACVPKNELNRICMELGTVTLERTYVSHEHWDTGFSLFSSFGSLMTLSWHVIAKDLVCY